MAPAKADPAAQHPKREVLRPDDVALLEQLEMLLELELLEDWDPDEDLPIPADLKDDPK